MPLPRRTVVRFESVEVSPERPCQPGCCPSFDPDRVHDAIRDYYAVLSCGHRKRVFKSYSRVGSTYPYRWCAECPPELHGEVIQDA